MLDSSEFIDLYKPRRPMATNSFEHGLYPRSRSKALAMRYTEAAPQNYKNLFVLDFDSPTAAWDIKSAVWDDGVIPEPNFVTVNPASEHAHAGWFIEGFLHTEKAKAYGNHIFRGLRAVSGSDEAYNGRLMRNPLHANQWTSWGTDHLYSLAELDAFASKARLAPTRNDDDLLADFDTLGGGRNDTTFNLLRTWAYPLRKEYADYDAWETAVLTHARETHDYLYHSSEQLTERELTTIARSVAKWVWAKLPPKSVQVARFSEIQGERSAQAAHVRNAQSRHEAALACIESGMTAREVGENFGLSKDAAKKLIRRARQSANS